jgi:hypothetical protein
MCSVEFEVTVDRLIDLTRPETRRTLRIQLQDLIRPRVSANAYEVTQRIASQAYRQGLPGLLAPTVHDGKGTTAGWFNLVLYPANLARAFIREVRVHNISRL